MSTYSYISAESIFAQIKEEFKSYFNTGLIDDILFPKYTLYVLSQFNKTYFKTKETPLVIEDGAAVLPLDLDKIKKVHLCSYEFYPGVSRNLFYMKDCRVDYKYRHRCDECFKTEKPCNACDRCENKDYQVLHMITQTPLYKYSIQKELLPSSLALNSNRCSTDCTKGSISSSDNMFYNISEDGCRLLLKYDRGVVHIEYYVNPEQDVEDNDEDVEIMIPDRPNFIDYLSKYIKYKCMESIFNQTSDETFNQVSQKYQLYKRDMEEAYIDANIESKKRSTIQKIQSIQRTKTRHNRFKIK